MTHDEQTVERVAKAMAQVSNHPADMRPLARAALDAIPTTSYYKCGAVWVNEPSEHTDPDYHGTHVCQLPTGHTDIRVPSDPMHMSIRGVTFRTSSTAREYTESEVATAVYRHFTTPSREQIARVIHDMTCRSLVAFGECEHQSHVDDWSDVLAHAIHALFEQNGANHD